MVSVLFSEPKIPQLAITDTLTISLFVSVLFSEPKIPQQRLQETIPFCRREFQCSSASRKFLNLQPVRWGACSGDVSVLFSEPKIPQPGAGDD